AATVAARTTAIFKNWSPAMAPPRSWMVERLRPRLWRIALCALRARLGTDQVLDRGAPSPRAPSRLAGRHLARTSGSAPSGWPSEAVRTWGRAMIPGPAYARYGHRKRLGRDSIAV